MFYQLVYAIRFIYNILTQLKYATKDKLIDLLNELEGFKFVATLVLELKSITPSTEAQKQKQSLVKRILRMYLNQSTIISNMQKPLGKGSGWIIHSVIDYDINISK